MLLLPTLLLAATVAQATPPPAQVVPMDQETFHHLVLKNAAVKVYDVQLPPGARMRYHAHPTPHAVVVISPARLRNEVLGQSPVEQHTGERGKLIFLQAGPAHRQVNADRTLGRWIAVEFAGKPRAAGPGGRVPGPPYAPVLDNAALVSHRLVLAPGQTVDALPYDGDFLGIAITDARLAVSAPGQPGKNVRMNLSAGTPTWYSRASKASKSSLENVGSLPCEILFIRPR